MEKNRKERPSDYVQKILNMKCPVTVVLAEKKMTLKEILALGVGTILEFDKRADDLLDVVLNNCTIARGETIKVGEHYGIQVRESIPVKTAIRSLGKS